MISRVMFLGDKAEMISSPVLARTRTVLIQNASRNAVYVGGLGVTIATGIYVPAGASFEMTIPADEALWGMAKDSLDVEIRILECKI